jgi:abortive infection alpha-like protein
MNEEMVQAAKAAAELEPAVEALAEATGALQPVRETTGWLADLIRYRRMAHQAKVLMKTAEKIRASGLPSAAVSDKLLRVVMEEAPMEDDADMQDRWANLLANAMTQRSADVRVAFPAILKELEPSEAALLDEWVSAASASSFLVKTFSPRKPGSGELRKELDNLIRLNLIRAVEKMPTTFDAVSNSEAKITGVRVTRLGWEFVTACQVPTPSDAGDLYTPRKN